MSDTQRYWDGSTWTDHIAPGTPAAFQTPPAQDSTSNLEAAAWLGAIFLPILGAICAVILLAKGKVGSGVGALVLSIVSAIVWGNLLLSSSTGGY